MRLSFHSFIDLDFYWFHWYIGRKICSSKNENWIYANGKLIECDWCIWNKSYKNCGNEIEWRMILAVVNAIYAIV